MSEPGDVRQVVEQKLVAFATEGCGGPFDENCHEYPERMGEWCAPCIMEEAYKLLKARRLSPLPRSHEMASEPATTTTVAYACGCAWWGYAVPKWCPRHPHQGIVGKTPIEKASE